jgi:hypothetical protein
MRHASGTCATAGGIKDIDDVFVSAIGEARAWAAQTKRRWGMDAGGGMRRQHYGACHARPGSQEPMRERTYPVSGRGAP